MLGMGRMSLLGRRLFIIAGYSVDRDEWEDWAWAWGLVVASGVIE